MTAAPNCIFYKNLAHFSKAYLAEPKSNWGHSRAHRLSSRARHVVVKNYRKGKCTALGRSQIQTLRSYEVSSQ
jgi:hypothetical protein